ncbi:hypothetical protein GCM10023162_22490 [Klenkia terrae]
MGEGALHRQRGAAHVGAERGVDVGGGHLAERLELPDAGVDVHGVQPGAAGGDHLEQGGHVGGVRGVGPDGGHGVAELGGHRVELRLTPSGEDDVRTLGDEPADDRQPDPRGPTGHQGGLAVEHCGHDDLLEDVVD